MASRLGGALSSDFLPETPVSGSRATCRAYVDATRAASTAGFSAAAVVSRAAQHRRHKGRREQGRFLALPSIIVDSPEWAALSAPEVKLLVDIFANFRGSNNGDLSCTWKLMEKRGWRSRDTLDKALRGLLEKGFLIQTRQGGRNLCNLYAITWHGVDECKGKLDITPSPVPLNLWRKRESGKNLDTPGRSTKHARRANGEDRDAQLTRPACQSAPFS